jgi:uncharacterized membrane protein
MSALDRVLRLLPEHGFHPVVVHFPIALFLFGAVMDLAGWAKGVEAVRRAGYWNMVAGALSSLVAVPTGLIIFRRSDYTWQGPVLVHFWSAVCAVLLMLSVVLWRRKSALTSPAYALFLSLAVMAVGAAGHFGGQLIYGP